MTSVSEDRVAPTYQTLHSFCSADFDVAIFSQGENPAVYGGRESDTPQHKPRSTLIQGYPL